MKWLVAVVAALVTVSAQAKVLECRLPSLKDPTETMQKMVIDVTETSALVRHEMNYPNLKIHREGIRAVLFKYDADVAGIQFTFLVFEEKLGHLKFAPLLANVDWGKGTLRTSMATDDLWEQRWVCMRLD